MIVATSCVAICHDICHHRARGGLGGSPSWSGLCPFEKLPTRGRVNLHRFTRDLNARPMWRRERWLRVKRAMGELSFAPSARRSGPKPRIGNGPRTATIAFLVFGTSGSKPCAAFEKLLTRGVSGASSHGHLSLIFSFVSDPAELPPPSASDALMAFCCMASGPAQVCRRTFNPFRQSG